MQTRLLPIALWGLVDAHTLATRAIEEVFPGGQWLRRGGSRCR